MCMTFSDTKLTTSSNFLCKMASAYKSNGLTLLGNIRVASLHVVDYVHEYIRQFLKTPVTAAPPSEQLSRLSKIANYHS